MPFGPGVGAAAFPRGAEGIVVFDDSKPVDLAALKDDPVFGSARVTLLAAATQITMSVRLRHGRVCPEKIANH